MVEDLALTRLSLGDQALIEHVEDILAHVLELRLDLLAVVADDADMLVRALGLLFLLDAGDDAPRSTTRADHVLVGDGQEVALVDGEFAADLSWGVSDAGKGRWRGERRLEPGRLSGVLSYLGDFLFTHVSMGIIASSGTSSLLTFM